MLRDQAFANYALEHVLHDRCLDLDAIGCAAVESPQRVPLARCRPRSLRACLAELARGANNPVEIWHTPDVSTSR